MISDTEQVQLLHLVQVQVHLVQVQVHLIQVHLVVYLQTTLHTVSQKKNTFIMLLQPQCTGSITSSRRHPLCLEISFLVVSESEDLIEEASDEKMQD